MTSFRTCTPVPGNNARGVLLLPLHTPWSMPSYKCIHPISGPSLFLPRTFYDPLISLPSPSSRAILVSSSSLTSPSSSSLLQSSLVYSSIYIYIYNKQHTAKPYVLDDNKSYCLTPDETKRTTWRCQLEEQSEFANNYLERN